MDCFKGSRKNVITNECEEVDLTNEKKIEDRQTF
jgi:hypothetical protein